MGAVSTIINALQSALPSFAKSDASIEAKIIDVVGSYADSEAVERQNTLDTINEALANQKVTRKEYYRRKSVEYQEGDVVSFDSVNQSAYYATVDPSKRLIKQSYIIGSFPSFINVVNAIDGTTGHLRILTNSEVEAFKSYFEYFQPLGMNIIVQSLNPAKISDDHMKIYVQAGTDLQQVLDDVKTKLIAHETSLRSVNAVTLSEIEDVIKQNANVVALGWSDPIATEEKTNGVIVTSRPSFGVFLLTTGVFIFSTELTLSHFEVLQ